MLDIGTKVLVTEQGMSAKAWGLEAQPTGVVVGHLHDVFNVVHLNLTPDEDPEGVAKGLPGGPGWVLLDDELEVIEG